MSYLLHTYGGRNATQRMDEERKERERRLRNRVWFFRDRIRAARVQGFDWGYRTGGIVSAAASIIYRSERR